MLVNVYSGTRGWVLAPAHMPPPPPPNYGPLHYEGTVPLDLIKTDYVNAHIWIECALKSYAQVSEDIGLQLLEASLVSYGTLTPSK
jgi:hypothetical protein